MKIQYSKSFLKKLDKLEPELQEEVFEKVELFQQDQKHPFLRVHKLKRHLKNYFSFSVNYKTRIIFQYYDENIILHSVGDHDVYK